MYLSPVNRKELGDGCESPHDVGFVSTWSNRWAQVWGVVFSLLVILSTAASEATESGHRYIPPASFTPSYDLDGNLLSDGEWNYKYDAENRLVQAERTTAAQNAGAPYRKVNYVYDSRHRRIERTVFHAPNAPPENTEKYLYDGLQRVLTADGNSQPIQSFVWGLDSSGSFNGAGGAGGLLWITDHSSNETHLVCSDDNGNVTKLIESATGEVTATYEYTPFGEIQRITGRYAASNPFRFSTKPQDSVTGLIGYTYRFFKPEWGVWLNRDPLGEAGGINLYAFLENDGINSIDLYGLANSGDVIQGAIEGAAANVLRNLAIKYGIRIGAKLALGAVGAVAGPAVIVTEAIALGLAIYDVASFVHDAYQAWKNFDEIKSQAEKAIDDFRVECMTDRACRELSKDFGGLIADALTNGKDIKSLIKRTKDKWRKSGALRKKKKALQADKKNKVKEDAEAPKTGTSPTTALSSYRRTQPGETFYHYGYSEHAAGFQGGLRPGGFSTTNGGLTGARAQQGLALPHATPPNAVYTVRPEPGTLIRGNPITRPDFGQPGGLPEFQFPLGTQPGSVSTPLPIR